MERIKFITDSACDLPEEIAKEYGISVMPIPITVDGNSYHERVDFTSDQFYQMLLTAKSIPSTAHITSLQFAEEYRKAMEEGFTHIIVVTINGTGSSMFNAATMAKDLFWEEIPQAKDTVSITVIDSKTYTMAYGYPLWQGAKMAREGKSYDQIVAYLTDFFDRLEIYFGVFTLEFVKKSGRVKAAAAFVGDVLGLRPIISIIDGETKVVDKVRGDKNVVDRIFKIGMSRRSPDTPVIVVRGMTDKVGEELFSLVETSTGVKPVGLYKVGASIAINAGPKVVGLLVLGEKRKS